MPASAVIFPFKFASFLLEAGPFQEPLNLPFQSGKAGTDFAEQRLGLRQILLGRLKPVRGLVTLKLERTEAGGLVKKFLAFRRTGHEYGVHHSLSDYAVRPLADPGLGEQEDDVAMLSRLPVHFVLALPVAVQPARNHDLRQFDFRFVIVHERKTDFREARTRLFRRTRKDNVFPLPCRSFALLPITQRMASAMLLLLRSVQPTMLVSPLLFLRLRMEFQGRLWTNVLKPWSSRRRRYITGTGYRRRGIV